MTDKMKREIEELTLELKAKGQLTATEFFKAARQKWSTDKLSPDALVENYNHCLGRLFGKNALSFEEVNKAMQP